MVVLVLLVGSLVLSCIIISLSSFMQVSWSSLKTLGMVCLSLLSPYFVLMLVVVYLGIVKKYQRSIFTQ